MFSLTRVCPPVFSVPAVSVHARVELSQQREDKTSDVTLWLRCSRPISGNVALILATGSKR